MAVAAIGVVPVSSQAVQLDFGPDMEATFNSTITAGFGRRMQSADCSLVGDRNSGCGAGANEAQWSAGDNGNLNYKKGDFFTAYLKGTHEFLLYKPDAGVKFMARGSWLKDFKADDTRRTELSDSAKEQIVNDARLLDLWVSKEFRLSGFGCVFCPMTSA